MKPARVTRAMMFAHGFGCDQNMWRFVAPAFEADFRTVLFDHVGAGRSDLTAYDPEEVRLASRLCRRCGGDRARTWAEGRRLRRAFGQRDDRRAGLDQGAGSVRGAGHGRAVAALYRRRGLPRRLQRGADRGAARPRSTTITWAGRPRWRRRSWATPTGPSWARS